MLKTTKYYKITAKNCNFLQILQKYVILNEVKNLPETSTNKITYTNQEKTRAKAILLIIDTPID